MERYQDFFSNNLPEMAKTLRDIVKKRINDVYDFDNLKNVFMSGRSVAKIPTASKSPTKTAFHTSHSIFRPTKKTITTSMFPIAARRTPTSLFTRLTRRH